MTNSTASDTAELEIALLRRSIGDLEAVVERCGNCHRAMLIGERVYEYGSGAILCALCRDRAVPRPVGSRRIHGPAFGHSIRVIDQRASARPDL